MPLLPYKRGKQMHKAATFKCVNGRMVKAYPSGKPVNLAIDWNKYKVKSITGKQMDRAYAR
jgi:hypothetical protein